MYSGTGPASAYTGGSRTAAGLVGHLPLSIVILAGRLCGDPTLTAAELAADLTGTNARLDETSPPGAGVRATFETSIQRLNPDDRRAFRTLGLHPGPIMGVPQFGALAGLPMPHAHSALRRLADQNLIKPDRTCRGATRCPRPPLTWYAKALRVVGGRRMPPALQRRPYPRWTVCA